MLFTHIVSSFQLNGYVEDEIKLRVNCAIKALLLPRKPLWFRTEMKLHLDLLLYRAEISPIFNLCIRNLAAKRKPCKKLESLHKYRIHYMVRISLPNHIPQVIVS